MGCVINSEDAARVRRYAEKGEVKTMDTILAVLGSRKNTIKQAIIGELARLDPDFKMAYREAKLVASSHVSALEESRLLNCVARGNSIAIDVQTTVIASGGKVTKGIIYYDMRAMNHEKKAILHAAAESGHSDVVNRKPTGLSQQTHCQPLLFFNKRNTNGDSAAHVAARYGHSEFVSILVKRGAW
ncbi:hypothetical protein DL770_006112 [Monosporascus sp. CRB-9-2]|nr:hypothetical protein DL770_006112 [Monosporascus sp. CRB-9-2]